MEAIMDGWLLFIERNTVKFSMIQLRFMYVYFQPFSHDKNLKQKTLTTENRTN